MVHKSPWCGIKVPIQVEGQLKLLGTIFDNDNSSSTQLAKTTQMLTQSASIVLTKKASSEGRIHAFTTVAINRALYTTQHSSLTLAELRQLDVPVNNFNRKITENMCSFPNAALSGPVKVAGVGCKDISSQINRRKKGVVHRNVHR